MGYTAGSLMQTRTSIYHKLILYIFLLGVFVIVSVSLYSFITSRNAILQRTFHQLTSLRVAKKEQLEQFFNDRVKEIGLFSNQQKTGFLNFKTKQLEGLITINLSNAALDDRFEQYFKDGGYYSKIYFINNRKYECYNLDSIAGNPRLLTNQEIAIFDPLFSRINHEKRVVIHDYSLNKVDSTARLYIGSPIFDSRRYIAGTVLFEIRPSAINNIMRSNDVVNSLGKSGEVYLVGPDSLARSESRFIENSILNLLVKTETYQKARNSAEGTNLGKDYRGVQTLASYSQLLIPGLKWAIIAEMDKKEAMRPVIKLAYEIVFLSIFITLILFVVSYIISHAIAGPIIELKNATIKVRNGDLDSVLHIKSNDELGELTENFNLMTNQLKAQKLELTMREMRLFSSFIDGQEDERQRLSRELHDGLGQMIIATKLKIESLANSGTGINNENILRLRLMFDSLVDEVRVISNNLMPAVLKEFGLTIALDQICTEIKKHSGINVIFDSQVSDQNLDNRIVTYVFRVAQEALNNAVKHSGASEIIMTLIGNNTSLSLLVQDDGVGINLDKQNNQTGHGLSNMYERVKLLNGLIDISKGVNNGTIVSVKIPLV